MASESNCTCCSFACAVCRILVYTCYRRVFRRQEGFQSPRPEFHVLCLGLHGSGKSTLLAKFAGESVEEIESTKGFSYKSLLREKAILQVQELGGSDKIRPYWSKYFSNQDGVIFVIDSTSSQESLCEAKKELQQCVSSDQLQCKPVLILCTKQDKPDAKSCQEIKNILELDSLFSSEDYFIESCSVEDEPLPQDGLNWMVETLISRTE